MYYRETLHGLNHYERGGLFFCIEDQANTIDAISATRRRRPIGKDMTQVRPASTAQNLGSHHAQAAIDFFHDSVPHGLVKTGPAAATAKLGVRLKQRGLTPFACVTASLIMVPKLARKRALRPLFSHDLKLKGRQDFGPFPIRFFDFLFGHIGLHGFHIEHK